MILLRLLTWPYLKRHRLRTLLTVAGIVLGVAVFVAMHAANRAVLAAFNGTVDKIAGRTQLQVTSDEAGFPEEVLERVQAVDGVRVAVPALEAVVDSLLPGEGNLLVLGVDMTGDRSLRDYDLDSAEEALIDDPLVFLAQPDSIMLSREFARRNHLAIGSRIRLRTMAGLKDFVVRGILRQGGLTQAFGGNLAIMDIYAAQAVFGRGRRFDRIDLAVADGHAVDAVRAAIGRELGPAYEVEPPSSRGRQFESTVRSYELSMGISSLFALFIGMFIIYNSFAIAVTQRRSEIGILRALGATRGQVRALFLAEGAAAGLVGSALGLLCGHLLAQACTGWIGTLVQTVYGFPLRPQGGELPSGLIALTLALGVATSVIAALLPARSAARVDPVQALQKGRYQVLSAGESRARRRLALVLALLSAGCLLRGRSLGAFYAGYILAILTAILLAPALSLMLSRALRPLFRRVLPVEGTLAADSLIQAPRRTSATVAALMLSLAMVIGFGGVSKSIYASVREWLDTTLNPDLFVTPSEVLSERTFHFPAAMGDQLAAVAGVAEVQAVRSLRVRLKGTPVLLVASDAESLGRHVRTAVVAGNRSQIYRVTGRGEGAIASENLSELHGVRLGDVLELATPKGTLRVPVVGVIRDYSDQQGAILIDRTLYRRWWDDDTVSLFRVYLRPGVAPADAARHVRERFAGTARLVVLTNTELRAWILRVTDQWVAMTYVQIAVAVAVAVLGIVNTLIVSITDRRRQLALLRAVGGLRRQVRRTVWMEALGIGLVGLALGTALGALNLYYSLEMVRRDMSGARLDYAYPVGLVAGLVPVLLAAAWLAALGPGEAAVRGSLTEALEYE